MAKKAKKLKKKDVVKTKFYDIIVSGQPLTKEPFFNLKKARRFAMEFVGLAENIHIVNMKGTRLSL